MHGLTLGIDVATAPLEAALWQDGHGVSLGSFTNTEVGWQALHAALAALAARVGANGLHGLQVVLEPTGGYELGVALWAHAQPGWQVSRPNPRCVRDWARAQGRRAKAGGRRAKTDRQD